jgi:hypothetical protein
MKRNHRNKCDMEESFGIWTLKHALKFGHTDLLYLTDQTE